MALRSITAALATLAVAVALGLAACTSSGSGTKGAGGDTGSDGGSDAAGAQTGDPGGAAATASSNGGKGSGTTAAGAAGDDTRGGDGAQAGAGATASSGGDNAGPGGLVAGKVTVPAGESAVGVVVAACVPTAAGDCDPDLSTQVSVTANSGVFSFPGPAQTFYLFGWKDTDKDTTLTPGDLFGGLLDKDNNLVELNAPVSGLSLEVVLVPKPTGTLPAELVGDWEDSDSLYTFKANGTYISVIDIEFYGTCLFYTKVLGSSEGTAVANGEQLTLTLTSGSTTSYDCWGVPTSKPSNSTPQVFTYFIDLDAQNVEQLHLTYKGTERIYRKR